MINLVIDLLEEGKDVIILVKDDNPGAHKEVNRSDASNTGHQSSASNTGDRSSAEVSGKESVAIVTGKGSKARGALGCWLVLTERGGWDGETYPILGMKAVKVDGKKVKADTWYKLEGRKIVEVASCIYDLAPEERPCKTCSQMYCDDRRDESLVWPHRVEQITDEN